MAQRIAPQTLIEAKMKEIVSAGNYDAVYLFSREGLPLAKAIADYQVDSECLAEMSISLQNVRKLAASLGGIERLKEVFMEGTNQRKIIFRFFPAFGEEIVLAAVVPPHQSYRKHTNDLQRLILSIKF